jgi:proteasome accessory factor A
MQDALFGTEVEYGCVGAVAAAQAAAMVKVQVFDGGNYGVIDPAPREWGEKPGNGGFLFNGGRLYIDSGHLEYATAECRTLGSIVAHEMAGDRILLATLDELDRRDEIYFVKNNTDYFGSTFGYHENYSLRSEPDDPRVVYGFMPFLVTRQLYAGAGMVEVPGMEGEPRYSIAQRSGFVEKDVSRRVRFGGRPIINLRDEPLGNRSRLHVIASDANRSEYATALKIGTTALAVQLLDDGWLTPVDLVDTVRDLRRIAANWEGDWSVQDTTYGEISAIEVQRMFLAEATRRYGDRDPDTIWTLTEWERVLDGLADDPMTLSGRVDWVTKLERLRAFAEDSPQGWSDPDLRKVDQAYHHIDPRVSLYTTLKEREDIVLQVAERHIKQAMLAPPKGTRAFGRAIVVRALAEHRAADRVDWRRLHRDLGEQTGWEENLFLAYQYIDGWRDLLAIGNFYLVPYMIDWDAVVLNGEVLRMADPFSRYEEEAQEFAEKVAVLLATLPEHETRDLVPELEQLEGRGLVILSDDDFDDPDGAALAELDEIEAPSDPQDGTVLEEVDEIAAPEDAAEEDPDDAEGDPKSD